MSFRLFVPILAGATWRDRIVACVGTLVGISLTGLVCGAILGTSPFLPVLLAPIGASAVLLFAVPASPLAQPWPIIGGNTISAIVGLTVAHLVREPILATGLGVCLAIVAMSLTRSLHPPGGAAALTMVLNGLTHTTGVSTALVTIFLNSVLLVFLGYCFHKLSRRPYPHVATPAAVTVERETRDVPPHDRVGVTSADIDAALSASGQTFDIDRGDLDLLLHQAELGALSRRHGILKCGDILTKHVVKITADASVAHAHSLLLGNNIRSLPVVDENDILVGIVGLRELAGGDANIQPSTAATALASDAAVSLIPVLSDGHHHAVVIVDDRQHVVGIVTQTDLVAALGRLLLK